MAGHGEKLTRKQEQAIAALMVEPTIEAAAAKVPVAVRTLKTWLTLPSFRQAYRDARRRVVESAVSMLQRSAREAAKTLRRNLRCGKPGDEIKAALGILDQAYRGAELIDLALEMEELRQQLAEVKHGQQ